MARIAILGGARVLGLLQALEALNRQEVQFVEMREVIRSRSKLTMTSLFSQPWNPKWDELPECIPSRKDTQKLTLPRHSRSMRRAKNRK